MKDVKILVVSDSHGDYSNIKKAVEKELPFDYLVHCGDIEGNLDSISKMGDFETVAVKGNCDYDRNLETEETFKAGFYNVWVTHGQKYNVKRDMELKELKLAAKERMADIVLFGHSHVAEIKHDEESGMLLLNPGCIGKPKTNAGKATYAVITVTEDYEIIPKIYKIED